MGVLLDEWMVYQMNGLVNDVLDDWIVEWVDVQMGWWMDRGRLDGWIDGQTDRFKSEWIEGGTDGWTEE